MLNGLLEYVVTLIVYKIKVPPWCAVLREAWRTLLMQMYDFFHIRQNFLLSRTTNDIATCIRSSCPAADTSDVVALSPMSTHYQERETQSRKCFRKDGFRQFQHKTYSFNTVSISFNTSSSAGSHLTENKVSLLNHAAASCSFRCNASPTSSHHKQCRVRWKAG